MSDQLKEGIFMRKRFSIILCSVLCIVSIGYDAINSSAQSPIKFVDTSQHWAEKAIQTAVEKKYVDGYEDGSFKPDLPISRAEFIKMLSSAAGEKVEKVEGNDWFVPYVKRLKELNVIPVEFPERYNEPLQRFEMAMLSAVSVDTTLKGTMLDAVKIGLIHGVSTTDLAPYGTSTRAQAITIIERILSAKKGEKLPIDKYAASAAEIAETGSNVGTMLGLKAKEMGTTWKYAEGVTVKLNKLIVADPADPDDPYMKLIDMRTWGKSFSKTDNKVIFANFTVVATEAGVGAPDMLPTQVLRQLDTSNEFLLTEQALTEWMRFNKPQTHEGYVAYALPNRIANLGIVFNILNTHTILAIK
ncbi:S-layer homology domain-containing protein [Paenibacillus alginolyticus]|uniref:S-layer homology domain-containing protein n=1 Tax=Paenibacillus alginolyticus TaxID=59839 RepID=UPI002DC05FE2|nr:S-layer homology domain-containing protein [Paenibacillus alginolyticus]MEC0147120.1 S-layer homology domain-containing protein [Paenibacillus alginolyticus]